MHGVNDGAGAALMAPILWLIALAALAASRGVALVKDN
jgi:hypothetical protein